MKKTLIDRTFALVGKNISYSFSKEYFSKKFEQLKILNAEYINFDIESLSLLSDKIKETPTLKVNITVPYKKRFLDKLDYISDEAKEIGAINLLYIKDNKFYGDNTDYYGFMKTLYPILKFSHQRAIVLGTGGASKAITFALQKMGIDYIIISRNPKEQQIADQDITKEILEKYTVVINCTPLGTFPKTELFPPIPYHFLGEKHLLYDLIYNPEKTTFLLKGEEKGAIICNGYAMLVHQAEAAWKIWNE